MSRSPLLPADAAQHVPEPNCFPQMLRSMSRSRTASPRRCAACPGAALLPADAARHVREASGQALVRIPNGMAFAERREGQPPKKISTPNILVLLVATSVSSDTT